MRTGIYQHFRGAFYQVLGIARIEKSNKKIVVYQALYGDFELKAENLDSFTENVEKDIMNDKVPKYVFVNDNLTTEIMK